MLNIPNLFPILKILKPTRTLFTLALTPNPIPSFGTKVPESSPFPITLQNHSNHQSSQPCLFPTLSSNTNPNMYTQENKAFFSPFLYSSPNTIAKYLPFPITLYRHTPTKNKQPSIFRTLIIATLKVLKPNLNPTPKLPTPFGTKVAKFLSFLITLYGHSPTKSQQPLIFPSLFFPTLSPNTNTNPKTVTLTLIPISNPNTLTPNPNNLTLISNPNTLTRIPNPYTEP
ncbi:hypothetical protein XELAEV_18014118mg [Xenopus laevis]|uniref:Uncharacterized protein n=1 Tax=Xenopus laevis TaxID=8355 RepID=A0A974DHC5_XENLA|nr:hypothetical protein XELAEV_18014118mg [Xenopus laevis]